MGSAPSSANHLKEYDEYYKVGNERLCSWFDDVWTDRGKRIIHKECNEKYWVDNRQENKDPWGMCPYHANLPKGGKNKKRRG